MTAPYPTLLKEVRRHQIKLAGGRFKTEKVYFPYKLKVQN